MTKDNIDPDMSRHGSTREPPRVLILDNYQSDLERIENIIRLAIRKAGTFGEPDIETVTALRTASTRLRTEKWSLVVSDLSLTQKSGTEGYIFLSEALDAGFASIGVSGAGHVLKPEFIAKMYNEFGSHHFRFVPKLELEADLPVAVKALLIDTPQTALGSEALEISRELPGTLDLTRFRVVGECYQWNEESRHELTAIRDRIVSAVSHPSGTRENFLLWAPPGTGKTFFVNQIMRSLGDYIGTYILDAHGYPGRQISSVTCVVGACATGACLIPNSSALSGMSNRFPASSSPTVRIWSRDIGLFPSGVV